MSYFNAASKTVNMEKHAMGSLGLNVLYEYAI